MKIWGDLNLIMKDHIAGVFMLTFTHPPPHFKQFEGDNLFQDATSDIPLQYGPSKLEYHKNDLGITSVQVGADYHHSHDERFTNYFTKEGVREAME